MTVIASALDGTDPLAHALHYIGLGWRIIPIPYGYKYPHGYGRWQDIATAEAVTVRQWYEAITSAGPLGIGLVTGAGSGVFALDIDPRHGGDDTLAALEAQHGKLPATVEAITGGAGRHMLFTMPALPPGKRLGNSAGKLGAGLDIRAEGGQIVVAPSIHPDTLVAYEWEASSRPGEVPVASAPAWLIDLLLEDVVVLPEGQADGPVLDTRFAWDHYESLPDANRLAVSVLREAGWHSPRVDRAGVTYMVRPGKDARDGAGCSVGRIRPGGVYVFTGEAPPLEAEHGYRLLELMAMLEHGGSREACDTALVDAGYGLPTYSADPAVIHALIATQRRVPDDHGNNVTDAMPRLDVDIIDFLAEPEPPYDWLVPDLIERGDRLILTGPEGGGKSTLLRQLAVQLAAGIHPFGGDSYDPVRVVLVDLENSRRQTRRKLRPLRENAGRRLSPDTAFIVPRPEGIDLADGRDIAWLADLCARRQPDLLIIGPIYKMANGDPTEETTAKPIITTLDALRVRHDCAVMIEAHTPSEYAGKSRLERPYGASIWRRWPEFGIFLDPVGQLRHWRGARDERDWPYALQRGKGATAWPWERATSADVTYAAMRDIQRAGGAKRMSVRAIADALTTSKIDNLGPVSKSTVARAIAVNRADWDALLTELGLEATAEPVEQPW